jgi:hypothetical protein
VVGRDAGHHDGRVDRRAVLEADADHMTIGEQDFRDPAAQSELAAVAYQGLDQM